MRKELEQRLVGRWPRWFNTRGDIRHTAMPRGFTNDDGWFDLLWRLCEDLEPLVAKFEQASGSQFEVLQVKEKFGGMRIHVNHANDAIRRRIEAGEQEYSLTCEVCGKPGKLRERRSIKTLCDEDASSGTTELSHSDS
jgi:hypothetical protein